MKYTAVGRAFIEQLVAIVGPENVVFDDKDQLANYAHDEVAGEKYAYMPEVVVKPNDAQQVSSIMKLANNEMVPVTPRGAGSGLSGGAVPIMGGIVLSVERMNRILEIDKGNLIAVL